jgi:hypothetical protein
MYNIIVAFVYVHYTYVHNASYIVHKYLRYCYTSYVHICAHISDM